MACRAESACLNREVSEAVARIENELLAARGSQAGYATPAFLPRKPIPRIGAERVDGTRFASREFMEREWRSIWTRTWQVGVHASRLAEPGDYQLHSLGKESLLFVRGDDLRIRAFSNVCQHRGNLLCQAPEGRASIFKCAFHGWEWNNDGSLRRVMHPHLFPQFANGVPRGELDLPAVRIDTWGGWVWFNLDPHAVALRDYLGEAGRQLESYELEHHQLIDHKTLEWGGNWKLAHDAFNESYHFEALHPEFMNIAEGFDVPIELLGIHSRMLNFNSTVSELLPDQHTMTALRRELLGGIGLPVTEDYQGSAKDVHLSIIRKKRAMQDTTYLPYKKLNDEQLAHQYHYTFFPGTTFTQNAEVSLVFRYRPHETEPGVCYFDFMSTANNPPGTPAPEVEHRLFRRHELAEYPAAFAATFHPVLVNVLTQDGANLPMLQQGTQSDSFRGMILGDQEVRLRHFHQTIDRFLSGEIPAELMAKAGRER
jgi:phenylpropionate dioxygenase-like ring-hydroxylating dioxygenase large terminal subunit